MVSYSEFNEQETSSESESESDEEEDGRNEERYSMREDGGR
jgi:hypothetical protein